MTISETIDQLAHALAEKNIKLTAIFVADREQRERLATILSREANVTYQPYEYEYQIATWNGITLDYD